VKAVRGLRLAIVRATNATVYIDLRRLLPFLSSVHSSRHMPVRQPAKKSWRDEGRNVAPACPAV